MSQKAESDGCPDFGGVMSEAYQWQFRAGEVISRCQGTFRLDEAASANLVGISDTGAAWGDYDNDGDLDIAISSWGGTVIYRNDAGVFITATTTTDISDQDPVWGDYDNDGDLDLLVQGWDKSEIFQNNSGTFASISANLPSYHYRGGDVDWVDYDNDGDLDVFISGGGGSLLFENDIGAGVFSLDAAAAANIVVIHENHDGTFTAHGYIDGSLDFGDYDNDGDLDLLITGDAGDSATRIYENQAGVFITDTVNSAVLDDMQYSDVAWGDYDNDGDLDILLVGYGTDSRSAFVYENQGGTFVEDTVASANLVGVSFSSADWGDYDNDGDLDILITGKAEFPDPSYPDPSEPKYNLAKKCQDIHVRCRFSSIALLT
jgi:hypothetical protein